MNIFISKKVKILMFSQFKNKMILYTQGLLKIIHFIMALGRFSILQNFIMSKVKGIF